MTRLYGKNSRRIWELDTLRGIAVLAMLLDHLMFDLAEMRYYFADWGNAGGFLLQLERWGVAFQRSGVRFWGHYIFVSLFLLLVGISCTFSRSNGKRAFQVFCCGFAVTVVTRFMVTLGMLDEPIVWGILQVIGFSILLYMTVRNLWDNRYCMLAVGATLLLAGILIGWTDVPQADPIPAGLTSGQEIVWFIQNDLADVMWGLKWYGPDHFGILPCSGMVLVGGYLGKTLYAQRRSLLPALDGAWNKPFRYVGRHAIVFYLAHQPVTLGLVLLIGIAGGLTLSI